MKVKSKSQDYLEQDPGIQQQTGGGNQVAMVCQDEAACQRRDGETKFGCSGPDCEITFNPDVGIDGELRCMGADANCAGAQVDPGGATLEFLNLNIDTKASLPHSNYLSRIFIAKHNRERSLDTMIFGVK